MHLKPSWGVIYFLWTPIALYWICLLAVVTPALSLPLWTSGIEGWVNKFNSWCFDIVVPLLFYLIPFCCSSHSFTCPVGSHSDVFDVHIILFLQNVCYFLGIFNLHKLYCAIIPFWFLLFSLNTVFKIYLFMCLSLDCFCLQHGTSSCPSSLFNLSFLPVIGTQIASHSSSSNNAVMKILVHYPCGFVWEFL